MSIMDRKVNGNEELIAFLDKINNDVYNKGISFEIQSLISPDFDTQLKHYDEDLLFENNANLSSPSSSSLSTVTSPSVTSSPSSTELTYIDGNLYRIYQY